VEAWWNNVPLENGSLSQTVKNLPAGIYRLEADALATWQEDESVEVTGVTLFAGNNTLPIATANLLPEHFSMRFINSTPQDVTIGVQWANTTANWVAADNFHLIYEGALAPAPNGTELVSSETDTLYIYNKEAGMFLGAGNSWGTHAVLNEEGLPVRMTQTEDGDWNIYFYEGSYYWEQYLFSEDENVWVDYNGQGEIRKTWAITANSDGTYFIQNKAYVESGYYLGNIPIRVDYNYQNGETMTTHIDVMSNATTADNIHWIFLSKAQRQVILAKQLLLEAIMEGEEAGFDTEGAKAVYYDANATKTEVDEAITDIKRQFNDELFSNEPSMTNPVDVTGLIVNPRFENNTTEGWTGAYCGATQFQAHEFYMKNFDISQTIYGLENGLYRLKFKGFNRPGWVGNVYDDYIAGTDNVTATVYANGEEKLLKNICADMQDERVDGWCGISVGEKYIPNTMNDARTFFDAGLYANYIDVEVTNGVLTIGIRDSQNNGDGHWVIFSDFELLYLLTPEALHNRISVADAKGMTKATTTVPVNLDNDKSISGLEFKVKLPDGITLSKAKSTDRSSGLTLSASKKDSYYQVLLYGVNKTVKGNSGTVINLALTADQTVAAGDYPIEIYDIVLSKSSGLSIEQEGIDITLTLSKPQKGDANRDGVVNISDVTTVVNYILGKATNACDEEAADVNNDTKINVSDITGIVNLILHGQAIIE
jgi:hypothetical protein